MIIAIDGPAASGKGTIARRLAAHFDFAHLDTGRLYRAVALAVLTQGDDPADEKAAIGAARDFNVASLAQKGVEAKLRSDAVSRAAAQVAAIADVRALMRTHQHGFAASPPDGKGGAVLDGRDIGTRIFPKAEHKLFITAAPHVRARRRWLELRGQNPDLTQEDVLADIAARDQLDMNRTAAPLKKADDAHLIDTSDLSIEEAFSAALASINRAEI